MPMPAACSATNSATASGSRLRREDGRRRQDLGSVKSGWVSVGTTPSRSTDAKKDNWQVRTDHFLVTTNHSLEAAAELAARLERLHQVWRQLFAGFYLPEREVRQLFAGERAARGQSRPFRVFYHRDRDEYVDALRRRQPRIAETLGIYFDTIREAHFFAGDEQDAGTLYHEAVHQLFQESRPAAKIGRQLGQFLDHRRRRHVFRNAHRTQRPASGSLFHGRRVDRPAGCRGPRAAAADGFYIPLAELTQLGKDDVQRHPEIAKLYSQSAGLAAFLMDADGGRYREPLVRVPGSGLRRPRQAGIAR